MVIYEQSSFTVFFQHSENDVSPTGDSEASKLIFEYRAPQLWP